MGARGGIKASSLGLQEFLKAKSTSNHQQWSSQRITTKPKRRKRKCTKANRQDLTQMGETMMEWTIVPR
jgi:hypothetical protein